MLAHRSRSMAPPLRAASARSFARADAPSRERASVRRTPAAQLVLLPRAAQVWDEEKGRHLEFGHNRQRSTAQGAHLHHALYAFDLLLLNGRSLLARPLAERRALLAQSVVCVPHRFETVEGETILRATRGGGGAAGGSGGASGVGGAGGGVAARIAERLNEAMGLGREGLMLKPLDSKYEPDSRGWLKIKPDYVAGAFRTLDVLIVGGYYGTAAAGRHWKSNGVSHFLLGLRAPLETAVASRTEHPPIFTFAKARKRKRRRVKGGGGGRGKARLRAGDRGSSECARRGARSAQSRAHPRPRAAAGGHGLRRGGPDQDARTARPARRQVDRATAAFVRLEAVKGG